MQRLDERSVGLQNIFVRQSGRLYPFQALLIEALRYAGITLDNPQRKFDGSICVIVVQRHELTALSHVHTQFFLKLPRKRSRIGFSRRNFSTWKLPTARHVFTGGTFGDQDASLRIVERGGDHADRASNRAYSANVPWQCLNFLPDPHGHGSLRPTLRSPRTNVPCASTDAGNC